MASLYVLMRPVSGSTSGTEGVVPQLLIIYLYMYRLAFHGGLKGLLNSVYYFIIDRFYSIWVELSASDLKWIVLKREVGFLLRPHPFFYVASPAVVVHGPHGLALDKKRSVAAAHVINVLLQVLM